MSWLEVADQHGRHGGWKTTLAHLVGYLGRPRCWGDPPQRCCADALPSRLKSALGNTPPAGRLVPWDSAQEGSEHGRVQVTRDRVVPGYELPGSSRKEKKKKKESCNLPNNRSLDKHV